MIVKNEETIIKRCVERALAYCDRYVIVDTGSTDETEEVALAALANVPGHFVHRPWRGFGPGKTEALQIAREEWGQDPNVYALVLDADEILNGDLPALLERDRYTLWLEMNAGFRFQSARIFRLSLPWEYLGVLHEFPTIDGQSWTEAHLDKLVITSPRDGARAKSPTVYADDAKLLEKAIAELENYQVSSTFLLQSTQVSSEPSSLESGAPPPVPPSVPGTPQIFALPKPLSWLHGEGLKTRYQFYLAQSYRDAGENLLAIQHYRKRAAMGGGLHWEEVYISHLEAGRALRRLSRTVEAEQAFLSAHHAYPARAEALRELESCVRGKVRAAERTPAVGTLFVETSGAQRRMLESHTSSGSVPQTRDPERSPYRLVHKGLSDNAERLSRVMPEGRILPGTLLEAIFYQHKGRPIDKWHHYLSIYEQHLSQLSEPVRLLEIGVQGGGSLQLWRGWFGSKATLHGLDIDPRCAEKADPPTVIHIGSQEDPALLRRIASEMGGLDIVIDDGSHVNAHQCTTFETLYPLLSARGVYICEDVHTSYWGGMYEGGWKKEGTFIEFIKDKIDALHAWYAEADGDHDETFARQTESIHIYDSIVVIQKHEGKEEPQRSVVGSKEPVVDQVVVSVPPA